MNQFLRQLARTAALLALVGGALLGSRPAQAQGTITVPQWMIDCGVIRFVDSAGAVIAIEPPMVNPYLVLWEYQTSSEVTKFDIWTNLGDPRNRADDFFFNYLRDSSGNFTIPSTYGSRLFSSTRNVVADDRPYSNLVTVRVDDPATAGAVTDLEFPGGSGFSAVFSPPIFPLQRIQGYSAPYRLTVGNDLLEITQKLQFARDLIRIEYIVRNLGDLRPPPTGGQGQPHRVGVKLLLDPWPDRLGSRSMFIPQTRERVFFEKDFGRAVGTTTAPRNPQVPNEWIVFDDDEGPNPNLIAKGIMTGNGATTPSRFGIVNSLNLWGSGGVWNYSTDFGQELRISDIAACYWWDQVTVNPGQAISFVTYAGVGVASHVMSNAYLASQRDALRDPTVPGSQETQGYIGAVQTPFAMPLVNGSVDAEGTGGQVTAFVDAYVQNQYFNTALPGAFAFLDLPDGLELTPTGQSQKLELGSPAAIGTGIDEGFGSWTLQATGVDAGLLPVNVTFSNGFQDSTRVTREINVPQGTRFQLSSNWRMFTFPYTYAGLQDDPATALGLDPGTFQILHYNPQTRNYELVGRLKPGEGYWLRLLNLAPGATQFVRLQSANPVKMTTTDTFTTPVSSGWNQIGSPSPYALRVRDLGVVTGNGQILDFETAVTSGLIRGSLYELNRKTGQYTQLNKDSLLQPGRGFWVFSTAPRTLSFRAPQGPGLSITP